MGKKEWEMGIGEVNANPGAADELLASTVSKRKRREIERQEELDEAEHTAKMAELDKKTKSAEAASEKVEEKKEPEQGFKMKGEFDLGRFNVQEMLMQQQSELRDLKKEADEAARSQTAISEDLRERLHAKEMEVLKTSFEAQMQILTKMIESNASRGSFADQLNAAREIAKELGFSQPTGQVEDPMTALKLKEMEFNQTLELRRLAREEKMSDRDWQLQLRRLDDERDRARREMERNARKDEMFAKTPEIIGRAIGQAMIGGQEAPTHEAAPKQRRSSYHIEAYDGDAGETACPECGGKIAIAPTARSAVCPGCNLRVPITRIGRRGEEVETGEEE